MSTRNIIALVLAVIAVVVIVIVASAYIITPANAEPYGPCAIQDKLKTKGYYDGKIDCVIGSGTEDAIRAFQADNGLPQVGRVGPATYKALFGTREEVPAADDYQPEDLKGNNRDLCADEPVEATAERAWTSRGLNAAWKTWEANVAKTEGLGLRYADRNTAKDVFEECIKASAGSRFAKNCTVRARPCRPS